MSLLQGKRIFYVEDDANNRLIVQTILEREGAKVRFEGWGLVEIIVPNLRNFRPDVILLDLMLPTNFTGYDVFDTLRKYPFTAAIPMVAISASDPAVELPKVREKGFAGFISKPVSLHDFPAQIAAVINGEPVWYTH